MVFITRRFMLSPTLLLVLFFSVLFSIKISSLGEEGAGLYASRAFVCLSCMRYFLYFALPLVSGVGCGLRLCHSLDFLLNIFSIIFTVNSNLLDIFILSSEILSDSSWSQFKILFKWLRPEFGTWFVYSVSCIFRESENSRSKSNKKRVHFSHLERWSIQC